MANGLKETKIVIFGAYDSGKTTTLDHLCDKKLKIDHGGTTISLDYGNTTVNGEKIHLFATPGQERFEFMREILKTGLDGAIVVIDNQRGITDLENRILEELFFSDIPLVIFANKQDLSSKELVPPFKTDVIPTIATEGKGLREGLEVIVNKVKK